VFTLWEKQKVRKKEEARNPMALTFPSPSITPQAPLLSIQSLFLGLTPFPFFYPIP
jgi:hypothetical protein